MKIVCISDTHNQHEKMDLPDGDVLIHAGDWTGTGTERQVISFIRWFASQPHKHKMLIAGNHEVSIDTDFYDYAWPAFHKKKLPHRDIKDYVLREEGITYLENSEVVIDGFKFWGSPCQPAFGGWAFGVGRGTEAKSLWSKIPEDTDVLITHGPPKDIGDKLDIGDCVGCEDLLHRIREVKPSLHIFGHIHEGYGEYKIGETVFLNASICDENYKLTNKPLEWELGK
jgi:hypothetical protein